MSRPQPVIAIDGPAGAGKSTVARLVAKSLGFVLVDTGAIYRGVALSAEEAGIDWQDGDALGEFTAGLDLRFIPDPQGAPRLQINGVDRADEIRTPHMSMGASHVSRHGPVRAALLSLQRRLGAEGGVVLEGRDIGTVVFPDAELKVFLTADDETRARRRVADLESRGMEADLTQTLEEIRARDTQDSTRDVAPLRAAADSIEVDTSGLGIEDVVRRVLALVQEHC